MKESTADIDAAIDTRVRGDSGATTGLAHCPTAIPTDQPSAGQLTVAT
jgi:hypothetical protein